MKESPFAIFKTFDDQIRVCLLTKEDAVKSDETIAKAIDRPLHSLASLHQVHGKVIARVEGETHRTIQADGMVTSAKNLTLTIRMADCQTFAVYAPKHHVCGVLHVGWKGLIAGGIENLFATLKREWNIEPNDVWMAAGPSLCMTCAEFTDPAKELPNIPQKFVDGRCVDLRGYADHVLDQLKVPREQRECDSRCTRCDPKNLWTYRGGDRERVMSGSTNVMTIEMLL